MNIELLLKVKERVLNEIKPVVMETWFSVPLEDAEERWPSSEELETIEGWAGLAIGKMTRIPSKEGIGEKGCNTAGCIAGHALMEAYGGQSLEEIKAQVAAKMGVESFEVAFDDLGQEALDLDDAEAWRLFFLYRWPVELRQKYEIALEDHDYLTANRTVAERIDLFIETEGKE